MLREAVFRRFGEARTRAQGIEFLSDNGPEYASHRFRPFVRARGLIPCHPPGGAWSRTAWPRCSSQLQAGLRVSSLLGDIRNGGTENPRVDRPLQPAGAAQSLGDAVTGGVLRGLESQKHKPTCPKLSGSVQS